MSNLTEHTYVVVRSDQYLSLLAFIGAGVLNNAFGWDFFVYLEVEAFLYVLFTFIRDWTSMWVTFRSPSPTQREDLD